ncbi:hypothetical protein DFH08DRAFT_861395 [Mycena albidolilacea]|uniref:Secreted protein n=1 Tax=Mycena albidolilacea TaxID=1033008 RepID=A0AAD7ETD1_9AGAR|nr:hypothetical protein DFH08DRAFT_861395 [Mycena albidolilacea]
MVAGVLSSSWLAALARPLQLLPHGDRIQVIQKPPSVPNSYLICLKDAMPQAHVLLKTGQSSAESICTCRIACI